MVILWNDNALPPCFICREIQQQSTTGMGIEYRGDNVGTRRIGGEGGGNKTIRRSKKAHVLVWACVWVCARDASSSCRGMGMYVSSGDSPRSCCRHAFSLSPTSVAPFSAQVRLSLLPCLPFALVLPLCKASLQSRPVHSLSQRILLMLWYN